MKKQFNNLNKLLLEQTDIITQELSNPNKKSTNNKKTKSKKFSTKTTSKQKVVESKKIISEQKKEEIIEPVTTLKEDHITKLLGQNTKEHIKTINLSQLIKDIKSVCSEKNIKLSEEVKPVEIPEKENYLDGIATTLKNIAINKESNLKQWIFTKKYLENNFEELLQFFPKKELISDSNLQLNIKKVLTDLINAGYNNKIQNLLIYLNNFK